MAGALVGDVAVVLPVTLGRHLDGDRGQQPGPLRHEEALGERAHRVAHGRGTVGA
jgi:hypothetical protein